MKVKFTNGAEYTHKNVPAEAVDNWIAYRSAGEFYHRVIKRYPLVNEHGKESSRSDD